MHFDVHSHYKCMRGCVKSPRAGLMALVRSFGMILIRISEITQIIVVQMNR